MSAHDLMADFFTCLPESSIPLPDWIRLPKIGIRKSGVSIPPSYGQRAASLSVLLRTPAQPIPMLTFLLVIKTMRQLGFWGMMAMK